MKPLDNPDKNRINPVKLFMSKWTAVVPVNCEKHFLVTEVVKNEEGQVISCLLEAVTSGSNYEIDWHLLKNRKQWLMGWH